MKRVISVILSAVLILFGSACKNKNVSSVNTIYKMQIAHGQPDDNPRHISLERFKEFVEKNTAGGVVVEIYPSGQLGSEKEMLELVCDGSIQGFRGGQYEIIPKLEILTLPFLTDTQEQKNRLLNSDFAKKLCMDSIKRGVVVLGLGDAGGFRQLSSTRHPITSPEDMYGLKMRTNGLNSIEQTFKAMGAIPVDVLYSELYSALRAGYVDGQDNPWGNVTGMKLYEVQRYFTDIKYLFNPDPFYVNVKWLKSLPEEYQSVIKEAAVEMFRVNNEEIEKTEKAALDHIKQYAHVYELTSEERQKFKDAAKCVYDQYIAEGRMTKKDLETMRSIIEGK